LFDEPAANLHPKAQMQLLSSFRNIASGNNWILYSTHSHYMVNPEWLEQTFIVANSAAERSDSANVADIFDNPNSITVRKYRDYVGQNPDRMTYFQPVLDRLDFAPSNFDILRPSLLVEGKGDYIILSFIKEIVLRDIEPPFIVPTRGATAMGELIGLFLGWRIPFFVCLDDDAAGRSARSTYLQDWGLDSSQVATYCDVSPALRGARIEGLLSPADIQLVSCYFGMSTVPNKGQIRLFFSEHFAARKPVAIAQSTLNNVIALLRLARTFLGKKVS